MEKKTGKSRPALSGKIKLSDLTMKATNCGPHIGCTPYGDLQSLIDKVINPGIERQAILEKKLDTVIAAIQRLEKTVKK